MPSSGQRIESAAELSAIGSKARRLGLRLSFHPSQFIVLNSPDAALVERSVWDLASQAEMLDLMGLGPEAVLVIHVGGTYGDVSASRERWVRTWETLPEPVRRRLVLEHDDLRFSASDTLWIHARTGVRLVFDHQHFWCLNPDGLELRATLEAMLRTWPAGEVAKIHYSSPRTELREQAVADKATGRKGVRLVPPVMTGHADYVNPFEFSMFLEKASGLDFDVMLEAKAKDLALFRLRTDLVRYGGGLAVRFGLAGSGSSDAAEA